MPTRACLLFVLCACFLPQRLPAAEITADQIIEKFAAASEDPILNTRRTSFEYRRRSVIDYLDPQGKSRKRVERLYQITPVDGEPVTKLLMVNGRPAAPREDSHRNAARQTGEKSRTLKINEELLSRYQFTLAEAGAIEGRPLHVLHFSPKPDAESDGFFDKLINAMHGTLWIDQEDYQLVKAEIHLGSKVSFFGGLAGAIEKLDLTLMQKRLEPGVWLPHFTSIDFSGRKLFSDMKFRCTENCLDFQKISIDQASTSRSASSKELN